MTIDELIERLQVFKQNCGGETEVTMSVAHTFFDGDYSYTEREESDLSYVYFEAKNGKLVVCDW